ncbi:acetyl-CoA synthetase-like protein [Coniochaeta ligniaria NRRL 30616]|uniref:Acetyl-CoA synthetase-like protein n=1 Tax=Coniochaeta ligniaria NRRL 30616 TaxID=1408157 RepID=A0A1J7J7G8_9PEZI|nr:acetyl-CoA synthetase-like protein [Coniochaeta ligniaria NRRL 30616]
MIGDADPPVVVCREALDARTLQEFVCYAKSLSGDSFGFPTKTTTSSNGSTAATYTYYSPKWIWTMATRAIRIYRDQQAIPLRDSGTPLVIGFRIYASVESLITLLALVRMGHTVLLIAPTLAADHVRLLVERTRCKAVINGLPTPDVGCRTVPLVKVEQLLRLAATAEEDEDICWRPSPSNGDNAAPEDETAIIIHSSASTGPPKVVPKTHRSLLATLRGIPPVFHDKSFFMGSWFHWMAGFMGVLFSFIRSGTRTCWSRDDDNSPSSSPLLTPDQILASTKPQVLWVQPGFVHSAAEKQGGVEALRRCIMVVVVGGALSSTTAERLLAADVRLATEYGLTEMPFGLSSAASAGDALYWDYVEADPETAPHLWFRPLESVEGSTRPTGGAEQLYELVVLPSLLRNRRGESGPEGEGLQDGRYHTGDLFIKHPTHDKYKCLGRRSGVVEINPTEDGVVMLWCRPYEEVVERRHADLIDAALLAGSRRDRPVLVVFVKTGCEWSDQDILDQVWMTVEKELNENGKVPLPLDREMVVLVRDATVPRTPKGEIMRPEANHRFRSVIDRAYD